MGSIAGTGGSLILRWGRNSAAFYVRTRTASVAAYSLVRNEVKQLDSSMPVYEMKTLQGQLDETLLTDRLIARLSAGFGLLATVLASIGLYGVMAFVVARRRKELGIRPHDPWIAGLTLLLLTIVSAAAGLIPAHRASRIDPILALRYE